MHADIMFTFSRVAEAQALKALICSGKEAGSSKSFAFKEKHSKTVLKYWVDPHIL